MKILNEENRVELIGTYKGHNITAMEDEFGMEYYCDDDFMNPFASIEDVKKMINMCDKQYSFVAEGCDRVFSDKGEVCFSSGKVWKGVEIAKDKEKVPKGFGGWPFIIRNGKIFGSKTPNGHDSFVRDEILSKRKFKNKEEYNKEETLINNRTYSICGRLFPNVNSDGSSILSIWKPKEHGLFKVKKNEIVILNAKRLSALIKIVGDFFNIDPSMITVQFKERRQYLPTYEATDEDVNELLEYTHELCLNHHNNDNVEYVNDENIYTAYARKPYSTLKPREKEMFNKLRGQDVRGNEELRNHLMKHNPNFTQAQWNAMSTIGDSKIYKKPIINEEQLRKIIRNTINEYLGFSKK